MYRYAFIWAPLAPCSGGLRHDVIWRWAVQHDTVCGLQDPGSAAFLNYGLPVPYLSFFVTQHHIHSLLAQCFLSALTEKWNRALEKIVMLLYWIAVIYVHANWNEEMQILPASRFARQPLRGHYFISWIVELIWPCASQHHMRYVLIGLKGMACCDLIVFTFMYISPCLL